MPAHTSEREISDSQSDASKEETQKRKHSIYTHFPKDQNWNICSRTKITRVPCRRRNEGSIRRAEKFGDLITADHRVLNEGSESRNNHRYAAVVQDLANQWIQSVPFKNIILLRTRIRKRRRRVYSRHKSQKLSIRTIYENLANPVKNYHGIIEKTTLHRSKTSGIAERAL